MKRRVFRRVAAITCWALGFILLGLYVGARAFGEFERRDAVRSFAAAERPGPVGGAGQVDRRMGIGDLVPVGPPDQSRWSAGRIEAYAEIGAPPPAAAVLRMRRVGLEVPVYADASERDLNRGAGLIAGTASPDSDGNVAIAAHRDGYFRVLQDVAVGDVVELDTLSRRRVYRVTEMVIVKPTDTWPLDETDVPSLTLVTCYPFYFVGNAPRRYIVRAVAIQPGGLAAEAASLQVGQGLHSLPGVNR